MMSEVVSALITGGLGAAIGSVGTAVVQSLSGRGESRAIAADRVTNAAGNLADRLDRFNLKLERENQQLRRAMVMLAEAVEDILPTIADEAVRDKVQDAINEARISFR